MHRVIHRGLVPLMASTTFLLAAGWPAPAWAGFAPGTLYKSFGGNGISSFNTATGAGITAILQTATNIVAGDGKVFFENGNTISWTSADLMGVHTLVVNNTPATGLALDASTGILYESFGAGGIAAIDSTTGAGIASIFQTATNIVAGGGKVYFENGSAIETTSSLLVGVNTFHVNGQAPAGLALDASTGILYESFGADGITAFDAATGAPITAILQTATNIVAGGGNVYFENGSAIETTSSLLVGVNTFHVNGDAPAGLALIVPTAAVPEPSTLDLLAVGLLGVAARRMRQSRARRCPRP